MRQRSHCFRRSSSALSPHSTISRQSGVSSPLEPYFLQHPAIVSYSQLSSGQLSLSANTSTRTRSTVANYGSPASNSQPSASRRSRRSHRRSMSSHGPSSRDASGCGPISAHGTTSSRRSGSNRRSRSTRAGSTSSLVHSRSLSLSFLEMNSPDLAEPAADFAQAMTKALDSVSRSGFESGPTTSLTANGSSDAGLASSCHITRTHSDANSAACNRGTFLPTPLFPSVPGAHNLDMTGITDCASVHPSSPPCPTGTPILPFNSISGSVLHSNSALSTRPGLSLGPGNNSKDGPLNNDPNLSSSPIDLKAVEIKAVNARTPSISSQPSPYLSPYYFSPSAFHLSPSVSSPYAGASPSPALEFNCEFFGVYCVPSNSMLFVLNVSPLYRPQGETEASKHRLIFLNSA